MGIEWKPGKKALIKAHRASVIDSPGRSADLDGCMESTHPSAPRWDYVLERTSKDRRGAGLEVHGGNASQVSSMIAKKRWAEAVLASLEPDLSIERWHWVVPPGSKFVFPRPAPQRASWP